MPPVGDLGYDNQDPHSRRLIDACDSDKFDITRDHVRRARQGYFANISYVDDKIGEISRLAVTPHFRRRPSDEGKSGQGAPESEMTLKTEGPRQHQPELVLGMYREVYQLCRQTGLDYCMAAMDNLFSRLLIRLGFPFVAVGPLNPNVTPARRVYIISATEMEHMLGGRETTILQFMQKQLNIQTIDPARFIAESRCRST